MSHECGLVDAAEEWRGVRAWCSSAPACLSASMGVTPEAALEHMRIDKKVQGGRIRLILLRKIGDAFITADYPGASAHVEHATSDDTSGQVRRESH